MTTLLTKMALCAGLGALVLAMPAGPAAAGEGHWKHHHRGGYDRDWRDHPGRGHGPPRVVYAPPRVIYAPRPVYVSSPPVLYIPQEPSISIILPIDLR